MRPPPVDPTTFVGREAALTEVREALEESPLVTLLGPGGVGKTRLALRSAEELAADYPGGVVFIDLSAVTSGDGVGPAVASALGVQEPPATTALGAAADHLHGRRCLLVVDNCEQVSEACAVACDRLVTSGTSRIIATSRVPLRARAEAIVLVDPLDLPDENHRASDCESVRLFVDRARRVRRPFTLDASNTAAVAELCRVLDGLPLAIELAAARIGAFGPDELLAELREHRSLLREDTPARPGRHRSVEACVAWSFGLLDPRERALAGRLSVFAGGFDLLAAKRVAADDLLPECEMADVIGRLVDASIVAVDRDDPTRYRLLDTIRTYARSTADDISRWHRRHLVWCEVAATDLARLHAAGDPSAHTAFQRDRENLFGAIRWATANRHVEAGMRVVGSMWLACSDFGGHEELLAATRQLLDAEPDSPVDDRARLGTVLAMTSAASSAGDVATSVAAGTEAIALAATTDDALAMGWAYTYRGLARVQVHDPAAVADLQAAVEAATKAGDDVVLADASIGLGFATALTDHVGDGIEHLERGVALATGHTWLLPAGLALLGAARFLSGGLPAAIDAFDDALRISAERPMGHHFFFTPFATGMKAIATAMSGHAEEASIALRDTLDAERDAPHVIVRSVLEVGLGIAGEAMDDLEAARDAYERALVLAVDPFWAVWARQGLADLAVEQGDLATARALVQAIRREATGHQHRYHLARVELVESRIQRAEGQGRDAAGHASTALQDALARGNALLVPGALEELAILAGDRGESELAARLLGAADAVRQRTGLARTTSQERRVERDLIHRVASTVRARFDAARVSGATRSVDDVLSAALAGRGARRRPRVGWDSLTVAEANVARLVSEGLSNPEIGERLFISRRTVERHLSNIFTKTGFTSRVQLAAEALRRRPS